MKIRKIKKGDISDFIKLSEYAFQEWDEEEPGEEKIKMFDPDRIIGAFDNEKIVSGLINHKFNQVIRGQVKKMGGIGGVSTYPEYRGRGLVRRLMEKAFLDMRENEMCVSMLVPFRESFYEWFGYVGTNQNLGIKVPLDAFRHYIEYEHEGRWTEKRETPEESIEEFIDFTSEAGKNYHGLVLPGSFSPDKLKRRFRNNLIVFILKDGNIQATARYRKKGFSRGFDWADEGTLIVRDCYWKNIRARNMLFKYFAKHRDQIVKIDMERPLGKNFYLWLLDTMEEIEANLVKVPWMVRIVNVKKAIENLRCEKKGEIYMKIQDEQCGWNNGTYRIMGDGEKLSIKDSKAQPDILADIKGLSSLIYGCMRTEELLERGWIIKGSPEQLEILDEWFPEENIFNTVYF